MKGSSRVTKQSNINQSFMSRYFYHIKYSSSLPQNSYTPTKIALSRYEEPQVSWMHPENSWRLVGSPSGQYFGIGTILSVNFCLGFCFSAFWLVYILLFFFTGREKGIYIRMFNIKRWLIQFRKQLRGHASK